MLFIRYEIYLPCYIVWNKKIVLEEFSPPSISYLFYVWSERATVFSPIEINYRPMMHSLIIRIVERIPTIMYVIKQLQQDSLFRAWWVYALVSGVFSVGSQDKPAQSNAMEKSKNNFYSKQ